jgi:transcriptional regulator with XRE-family HTH domain
MSRINSRAELARELGVSRTYVTLLCQGKRQLTLKLVNKLAKLQLAHDLEVDMHKHEHTTFNQGVTGSNPVRPIQIHARPFLLLDKFLQSRRQGSSARTI